jgi:ornithine cyclodeaminase/alanine dehydrogenase-like protein (mu-crystallin family)
LNKQSMLELGEIVTISPEGNLLPVLNKQRTARSGDVTIFKSVGVAVQDVAIAAAVVERAESMKLGTRIGSYDL